MDGSDIANLVIILIFLLSGVIRRLIQPNKGKAPAPQPTRPAPARPQAPLPGAPQPSPQPARPQHQPAPPTPAGMPRPSAPTTGPSPYVSSLLTKLESYRERARDTKAKATSTLQHDSRYAPLANQLLKAITEPTDRVLAVIEEILAIAVSGPAPSTLVITQAIEQAEDELAFAKWILSILRQVEEQRSKPTLRGRLEMLDDLINTLVKAHSVGTESRLLFTLLWEGDTALPSLLLGPGQVGLAAIRPQDARSATGTAMLARAAAFDAIASATDLRANLREAIMVGPLAGRRAQPPFYARGNFEPIVAMACWAPAIAADLVAANLLGPSYAKGLIEAERRRGLSRKAVITIAADRGLYLAEPPLWVRLAAVDAVLHRDGDTAVFSAVDDLESKLQLQGEFHYQMPNGAIRRLHAQPMLDLVGQVSLEFLQQRLPALGERTLDGILTSSLHAADSAAAGGVGRAFLRHDQPSGEPLRLWLGAMEAELELADNKTSFMEQLARALEGPEPAVIATAGTNVGRDTLLRDAYVLSEII